MRRCVARAFHLGRLCWLSELAALSVEQRTRLNAGGCGRTEGEISSVRLKGQLRFFQQRLPHETATEQRHPEISSEGHALFEQVWNTVEDKYGTVMTLHDKSSVYVCVQDLIIPRETVWLNGAPGAGKVENMLCW